jgi:hypothetical protein
MKSPRSSVSLQNKQDRIPRDLARKDADAVRPPFIHLVSSRQQTEDQAYAKPKKCAAPDRIAQALSIAAPKPNIDPHLLLHLAERELIEGREDQARHLVEAAYEIFDLTSAEDIYWPFRRK